ncbi:cell division protein ZapB [Vulcanisaeta distributa]|uniref:cell division protein ZapB n=1 Tax=Vulcanisaeta distributa TaxID=164451 RepID=UPI000AF45CC2|nr:cell division protein ZapB [Vulcanisaeta distributa]
MGVSRATIALAALVFLLLIIIIGLYSSYESVISSCNSQQSSYFNLQQQYSSLNQQYQSLQNSYNSLQSEYNALQQQYQSLESQYSALQSQYNNLQQRYTQLLNSLGSCSYTNYQLSNGYAVGACVIVVPPGYSATTTISVTSTATPVEVYVLTVFWQYANWAVSWHPSSYVYYGNGMSIYTTLNLGSGDYVVVIQNAGSQPTLVTYSITTTYTPS